MGRGYLFNEGELHAYLERQRQALAMEIDQLPPDTITGTNIDELTSYLLEKHALTTPVLDENNITVDQAEAKLDVSGDYRYIGSILHPGQPHLVPGTRYTYYVPFTGNADLFRLRPNQHNLGPPIASINGNQLHFTYEDTQHDVTRITSAFTSDLAGTNAWLRWSDHDVQQHNNLLPAAVRERLTTRRDKLTKDRQLVENLGYPIRRRVDAPPTYTLPKARKQLPPPQATGPAERLLDNATYEDILSIIQSMALVLERSPNAFRGMTEEDLRTHFLVQLNGQYDGAATGETFNATGKTDILVRQDNKNLFIAECKFWNGPSSLTGAIDQLLGYASWRDTKTAILLFSRNKNFTDVLKQLPDIVKAHPNTIRQELYASETGYRFTLHQQHDAQRHVTLTVLAFNIPT